MKKLLLSFVICVGFAGMASAQYVERGGFKDPATIVNTVSELKHMQDDSYVVLEGKIEKTPWQGRVFIFGCQWFNHS